MEYFVIGTLILNILWFAAAFHLFSIKSALATKMFISKKNRIEPYNAIISRLLKFLGGFNLAMAALSVVVFYLYHTSVNNKLIASIFVVFFIAHGSQFWFNVSLAIKEKRSQLPIWPVLKGRMYFIFKTDFLLTICNLIMGIYLLII